MIASSCGRKGENNNPVETKSEIKSNVKTIQLTTADFPTKVADYRMFAKGWKYLGDKPAIVDFYTTWCGPCKMIAPILDELAGKYGGKIYIYKVNIEQEMELAEAFGIQSIPSLLFIPLNGQPTMFQGAMSKEEMKQKIEKILLSNR